MQLDLLIKILQNIKKEPNSHNQGYKQVFLKNLDTLTNLTQFAFGSLDMNNETGFHQHDSMEEYFFILKGCGILFLNNDEYLISSNSFIRIPSKTQHQIKNINISPLEFIYFGISLEN
jgi:mannose-6-phosphate isomerase-like protein (cupin superfamily)